ncbi:alanine dehydrogenase [bacterium]|nr:alanine dehydrogenase [bacterium]
MIFGIPKEVPMFRMIPECRVGLSPRGVRELVDLGAEVYFESNAGAGAGFSNMDYQNAGGKIVYSKAEAYQRADVVLKVKAPQPEEYKFICKNQTLLGFFHLVTAPKELIKVFSENENTVIGYEVIQRDNGELPIVVPMSEIAGILSVQLAGRLLESVHCGRGILLSGIPGISPAEVVILGAGTLGRTAARSFSGIGANVYILDINKNALERIFEHSNGGKVTTLFSNHFNIEKVVKFADVLIGAVLIPGERTPTLVTREMVKSMKKGAVILDFSIDQGGCVETSKTTPCGEFSYIVDGVVHFCMPTATTLVARTATHAITNGVIPYLQCFDKYGVKEAIEQCPELQKGIYLDNGNVVKEYIK